MADFIYINRLGDELSFETLQHGLELQNSSLAEVIDSLEISEFLITTPPLNPVPNYTGIISPTPINIFGPYPNHIIKLVDDNWLLINPLIAPRILSRFDNGVYNYGDDGWVPSEIAAPITTLPRSTGVPYQTTHLNRYSSSSSLTKIGTQDGIISVYNPSKYLSGANINQGFTIPAGSLVIRRNFSQNLSNRGADQGTDYCFAVLVQNYPFGVITDGMSDTFDLGVNISHQLGTVGSFTTLNRTDIENIIGIVLEDIPYGQNGPVMTKGFTNFTGNTVFNRVAELSNTIFVRGYDYLSTAIADLIPGSTSYSQKGLSISSGPIRGLVLVQMNSMGLMIIAYMLILL